MCGSFPLLFGLVSYPPGPILESVFRWRVSVARNLPVFGSADPEPPTKLGRQTTWCAPQLRHRPRNKSYFTTVPYDLWVCISRLFGRFLVDRWRVKFTTEGCLTSKICPDRLPFCLPADEILRGLGQLFLGSVRFWVVLIVWRFFGRERDSLFSASGRGGHDPSHSLKAGCWWGFATGRAPTKDAAGCTQVLEPSR